MAEEKEENGNVKDMVTEAFKRGKEAGEEAAAHNDEVARLFKKINDNLYLIPDELMVPAKRFGELLVQEMEKIAPESLEELRSLLIAQDKWEQFGDVLAMGLIELTLGLRIKRREV